MKKINSSEVEFKLVGKALTGKFVKRYICSVLFPTGLNSTGELTSGEDTPPNQWHLLV